MALYLVGEVGRGVRPLPPATDHWPPTTSRAARQALRVVQALRNEQVVRIVSGPSTNCLQTIWLLARERAFPIEVEPLFGEIASVGRALGTIVAKSDQPTVICMPTALLQAIIDLLLLVDVPVYQLDELPLIARIDGELDVAAPEGVEREVLRLIDPGTDVDPCLARQVRLWPGSPTPRRRRRSPRLLG